MGNVSTCGNAIDRRRAIKVGAGALASVAGAIACPARLLSQRRNGRSIRGLGYDHRFFRILQGYIPEFQRATGITVDLKLMPFPDYNREVEKELSGSNSSLDFLSVTFFLAAQWIASGYLSDLDLFSRAEISADWDASDFVAGAQLPYKDAAGRTYAYAWEGGAMVMGISRMDVMERRGLRIPKTFDELVHVCEEMNATGEISGFVSWHLHHWCLIPYLQGMGGDVFRNAPSDMTPTLDSPAAARALELYAGLMKYAPRDARSYTEEQARQSFITGRSNLFIHSSSWVTSALTSDESRVRATARIARMPSGPLFDRPAANSQGLGIAKNSRNQAEAWEFIRWALSRQMCERMVREHGQSTVCRRSVITSDSYRKLNTVQGQDLGSLYLDVLEMPARGRNYMAYRTAKEFPAVGAAINRAVDSVLDGKADAASALKVAQSEAVASLR